MKLQIAQLHKFSKDITACPAMGKVEDKDSLLGHIVTK